MKITILLVVLCLAFVCHATPVKRDAPEATHAHGEHDNHAEHKHDHAEHKEHDHAEPKHDHAEHKHDHADHKHDHADHKHDHAHGAEDDHTGHTHGVDCHSEAPKHE